jgi:hypothetical protein
MSQAGTQAASALAQLLKSDLGVARKLFDRLCGDPNMLQRYPEPTVQSAHITGEQWEKAGPQKYPQLVVYCERIRNLQTDKFKRFSGVVDLAIEVRNSGDHVQGLEQGTLLYVEAVSDVIEECRGEWRPCVYSTGQYDVKFEPVKPGGKRFLQVAHITVPVQVKVG